MDIYCPRCGEPWEHDSLHDVASERYGIPYYVERDSGDTFFFQGSRGEKNPDYNSDDYQKVFTKVSEEFRTRGCGVVFDGTPCKSKNNMRALAASAMYDLLGDDMDGAAAMLEDAEMMGMFDDE